MYKIVFNHISILTYNAAKFAQIILFHNFNKTFFDFAFCTIFDTKKLVNTLQISIYPGKVVFVQFCLGKGILEEKHIKLSRIGLGRKTDCLDFVQSLLLMFWDGVRITKSNITEENTVERVIFIYFALRHLQIYPLVEVNQANISLVLFIYFCALLFT